MKQIIPVVVLVLTLATVSHAEDRQGLAKDWCLFEVQNKCPSRPVLDLSEKIRRIETAIGKGAAVYTTEELQRLHAMLAEAYTAKEIVERY